MAVPTLITDLSITAGSNPPDGSETTAEGDNHLRAHAAFIAQLNANKADKAGPTFTGTVTADVLTTTGNTTLGNGTTDTLNVGSDGLVKDASGNIGVGTASPAYPLDIRAAEPYVSIRKPAANTNYYGYNVMAGTDILSSWLLNATTGEVRFTSGYTGFGGSLTFWTNGLNRMTIDSSGNNINHVTTSEPSLGTNQQMVFALTSNTNLRVAVRGTDGVTRTANITLA